MDSCAFNKLFAKNVPHILENIFLSLDYESYKVCLEVNDTWEKLLSSEDYQKIGKSVFRDEILVDEQKLWNAAENGNENYVKRLLLSKMIDINSRHGNDLCTPLHQVAKGGNIIVGQLLLDRGGDPNGLNVYGDTPLHEAIHYGHKVIVKILLDGGADPNRPRGAKDVIKPLYLAVLCWEEEIVKLLLERGAEVNWQTPETNNFTPLHYAAAWGSKGMVRILLDKGANPNKADLFGRTPISLANELDKSAKENAKIIANYTRPRRGGRQRRKPDRLGV